MKGLRWRHFLGYKHCAYIRGDTVLILTTYMYNLLIESVNENTWMGFLLNNNIPNKQLIWSKLVALAATWKELELYHTKWNLYKVYFLTTLFLWDHFCWWTLCIHFHELWHERFCTFGGMSIFGMYEMSNTVIHCKCLSKYWDIST